MHDIIPRVRTITGHKLPRHNTHATVRRNDSLHVLRSKFLDQNPTSLSRLKSLRTKSFDRVKRRKAENRIRDNLRHSNTFVTGETISGPALTQIYPEDSYLLRLRQFGWGTSFWSAPPSKTPLYRINYSRTPVLGKLGLSNRMKSHIQFITTPTADTPGTTLLLHFDNRRYLLGNMAEGTQRACVQRKVGLGKVQHLFMTGKTDWASTGGLLGMILTLADSLSSSRAEQAKKAEEKTAKKEKSDNTFRQNPEPETTQSLNIHGAKNLTHMLCTARRFVFRKGMPLYANEYRENKARKDNEPDYTDSNLKMWAMIVSPENGDRTRKRSHEEFEEEEKTTQATAKLTLEEEDANDQIRRSVVASMFNSDWQLDALHPSLLSEVKQPAAVFIRNEGKLEKYQGPMPGDEGFEDIKVFVRKPWPGAMIEALPSTKPSKSAISYIIKNHPQRGKFDPQAAIRLGVKPGPDFAHLTRGMNVETKDGSIVTPDMVLSATRPGSGFAVIELPTAEYVAPMIQRPEWTSEEIIGNVAHVIWILGPGVGTDERLVNFMRENSQFGHIVSSPDHCANSLALESPSAAAIRLHLVDPDRFPIPQYSNVPVVERDPSAPYTVARTGLLMQLEPTRETQENHIISYLDTNNVIKEMPKDVLALANQAHTQLNDPAYEAALEERQKDLPGKDAEIITLGTGSALPSKYRNVSATLLKVPGVGNYLLDCGENTLGQLKRVFGSETPAILRDLKGIWISHLHADHHLGTASVIRAWYAEISSSSATKDNKLIISSDYGMLNWLKEYSEVEDYGYSNLVTIPLSRQNNHTHEFPSSEAQTYGLTSIKACPVSHCYGALAVVLNFTNDLKVAYSGDCRPSKDFVRIGKGTTLLIHEATFDDELMGDAIAKKHSTTSEALEVGRGMGARRILLTHFSQRYQKIPVLDVEGDVRTAVAFDYMRVKIGDIARVETFRSALLKLYEEEEKEEKKVESDTEKVQGEGEGGDKVESKRQAKKRKGKETKEVKTDV